MDALLGHWRLPPLDDVGAGEFHRYFDDKIALQRHGRLHASFRQLTTLQWTNCSGWSMNLILSRHHSLKPSSMSYVFFLMAVFSKCLSSYFVLKAFKDTYITSLLKKLDMEPANEWSYEPALSLSVVSRLLGRLVARQLLKCLSKSVLFPQLQCWSLDRNRCLEGIIRHSARRLRRRPVCTGVAGSVCGLRHGGPRPSDLVTEDFWIGAAVLLDVLGRPTSVRPNQILGIISDTD